MRIEWGEGTRVVDLRKDVDFEDSWNEGDYIIWASRHRNEIVTYDPLWYVPERFKPFVESFAFPWR